MTKVKSDIKQRVTHVIVIHTRPSIGPAEVFELMDPTSNWSAIQNFQMFTHFSV